MRFCKARKYKSEKRSTWNITPKWQVQAALACFWGGTPTSGLFLTLLGISLYEKRCRIRLRRTTSAILILRYLDTVTGGRWPIARIRVPERGMGIGSSQ